MKIKVYRGTKEIGGTLLEISSKTTKVLFDAGYPLFLNQLPIDDKISKLPHEELLQLGVLPDIKGLYHWYQHVDFDGVVISHAHLDHYGLAKYIHPSIPVYYSDGTKTLMEITNRFIKREDYVLNSRSFKMYQPFQIGDIKIKPYLMDHSAYDAAAFEIHAEDKTIIYTGDFRGHGRKGVCLDRFIDNAKKKADVLLTEGTMLGRKDETVLTEDELEMKVLTLVEQIKGPILFQSSSQNIDRIVTFYRVALRLKKTFVVDVYTANVLYELRQLGNNLPYPSSQYANIKVFYPYYLTQKIFNEIGEQYAKRFSAYHMPKEELTKSQENIVMMVRPSMLRDLQKCDVHDGVFLYSLWVGYRDQAYQRKFEEYLKNHGFDILMAHTSGHASVSDLQRVINGLDPKLIVPIHTMTPTLFSELSDKVRYMDDGEEIHL